jgi:glycosyltransferase involved in cell wall biosynthesis
VFAVKVAPPGPKQSFFDRKLHPHYKPDLHPKHLQGLAKAAQAAAQHTDCVLALGQGYLATWSSDIPASFFSDTLYGSKFDLYENWMREKLDNKQIEELRQLGQAAVNNASHVFVTSQFAADRAYEQLGTVIPPEKLHITLIGANLSAEDLDAPTTRRYENVGTPQNPLKLLWIGVNWQRKGGAEAYAVAEALAKSGISVELHVVGCEVPPNAGQTQYSEGIRSAPTNGVVAHGFLRKTDADEKAKLVQLFREAHVFLLPTRADLTPVVLAEAAAFGLPIVTTRIGGIPEMFPNGEAILVEGDDFVGKAAQAILDALHHPQLESLGQKARARYEAALNWDVIAQNIIQTLGN